MAIGDYTGVGYTFYEDIVWCSAIYYIIGEVESNRQWDLIEKGVQRGLGIWQWSNVRAYRLIYDMIHSVSTDLFNGQGSNLEQYASNNQNDLTFNGSQCTLLKSALGSDDGKQVQITTMNNDVKSYQDVIKKNSLDGYKEVIYWLSMYHQSPRRMYDVLGVISPNSDLDTIHKACLNNKVFGNYKNRYNTVYNLLKNWDGNTSFDLGFDLSSNGSFTSGDVTPDARNDDNNKTNTISIKQIEKVGSELHIYNNDGTKIISYLSSANVWTPYKTSVDTKPTNITIVTNTGSGDSSQGVHAWEIATSIPEGSIYYTQGAGRQAIENGSADCSGFMWWVFKQMGITIPIATGGYDINKALYNYNGEGGRSMNDEFNDIYNQGLLQTGDVILWRNKYPPSDKDHYHGHVAIWNNEQFRFYEVGGGSDPNYGTFAGQVSSSDFVSFHIFRFY